jgi:hypothetical protein
VSAPTRTAATPTSGPVWSGVPGRVSVVVDVYQAAEVVGAAIDSALAQRHDDVEVVVVDDGSTDGTWEVVAGYGDRLTGIHKANGGQASALNVGFAASTGQVVIFLDGDDLLEPTAARDAAAILADPGVGRVQWPMRVIHADGRVTRELVCEGLEEGYLGARVLEEGPFGYGWSSTSGNAWQRSALEAVLPIPEDEFRLCPDIYLAAVTPLYGEVRLLPPRSCWRRHATNGSRPTSPFDQRLEVGLRRFEACLDALREHSARQRLDLDEGRWRRNAWFHRVARAMDVVADAAEPGATVVVADADAWELEGSARGLTTRPFLERGGSYHGPPADGTAAVAEVERQRAGGASLFAVGWPDAWLLEAFPELSHHLDSRYDRVAETPDVTVFALR